MTRLLAALVGVLTLAACEPSAAIRWAFRHHPQHVQEQAIRVATCESRLQPTVTNGSHKGLFQISTRWHSHRPGMTVWWDAVANAVAAAHLYDEQGWSPWSCRP